MNVNQIGREVISRLVENQHCDIQSAIRFFYNSDTYTTLSDQSDNLDALYQQFEKEFISGMCPR